VGVQAPPPPERRVFVARQPILDAAGAVHGHELLFRGTRHGDGTPEDADRATAQVLVTTFLDVGVAEMAGRTPLAEGLRELPLEEPVCAALLRREGPAGVLLGRACAAERGEAGRAATPPRSPTRCAGPTASCATCAAAGPSALAA